MKIIFLTLSFFLFLQSTTAQEKYTQHTFTAGKNYKPCTCKIEQLTWMTGSWQGADDDTISEEQWARPIAGIMMGMYRMIVKGKPLFYELMMSTH